MRRDEGRVVCRRDHRHLARTASCIRLAIRYSMTRTVSRAQAVPDTDNASTLPIAAVWTSYPSRNLASFSVLK